MKGKLQLAIAALLVLILSGGFYAYTFTTAGGTIGIAEPTGDIATCNTTATQPDWDAVLDDLSSENKTCGEIPSGNIYAITPNAAYSGDMMADVYLTNTANLTKAFRYYNIKLYLSASEEAEGTPDYRMLTLQNGDTSFTMSELAPVSGTWTQTSQSDFEGGTLNQVDTTTSPGDVILDTFSDNVTDSFDDQSQIASSVNITVSGGQAELQGASDTETLRPTGAGDETTIENQFPITGAHWDKVSENVSDGDSTYVSTYSDFAEWTEDLYQIADHSAGSGQINYVRVYAVARSQAAPISNNFRIHIKTNGAEHNGTELQTTTSYVTYSYTWNQNPETTSDWTWTDIDNLQAGISLLRAKSKKDTRCTQVYVEVNYTAYRSSGTINSVNLLSGEDVASIDSFDYNASAIPSGSGLKVQFSTDNTSWYNSSGTSDGWDTLSQGTHNIDLSGLGWSGANFYYNMLFTSDGMGTPVLDEIRVNFSTYYSSGELTSSAYDVGYDLAWDWGNISFTVSEPSTTDIKFQIRSAATEAGLSSATWYGPTGTGDYYQVSGSAINSVHDGDRWIQYKAYFSGPAIATPTLSDVSITYSGQALSYIIEVVGGGYCLVSDNTSEWGSGWTVTPELYCEVTQR